jgi:hypothetical protein
MAAAWSPCRVVSMHGRRRPASNLSDQSWGNAKSAIDCGKEGVPNLKIYYYSSWSVVLIYLSHWICWLNGPYYPVTTVKAPILKYVGKSILKFSIIFIIYFEMLSKPELDLFCCVLENKTY